MWFIFMVFGGLLGTASQPPKPKTDLPKEKPSVTVLLNQDGWDDVLQLTLHRNGQFFTTLGRPVDDKKLNTYCQVPEGITPRITIIVLDSEKTSVRTVEEAVSKFRVAAKKEKVQIEINLVIIGFRE